MRFWTVKLIYPRHFYKSARTKPGKRVAGVCYGYRFYFCFYVYSIECWSCSNSVIFFLSFLSHNVDIIPVLKIITTCYWLKY